MSWNHSVCHGIITYTMEP